MRGRGWLALVLLALACDSPTDPDPEQQLAVGQLVTTEAVPGCWGAGVHLGEIFAGSWTRSGEIERPLTRSSSGAITLWWNAVGGDRFGTLAGGRFSSPLGMASAFQACTGPAELLSDAAS